jgi:hypothetical protein
MEAIHVSLKWKTDNIQKENKEAVKSIQDLKLKLATVKD